MDIWEPSLTLHPAIDRIDLLPLVAESAGSIILSQSSILPGCRIGWMFFLPADLPLLG